MYVSDLKFDDEYILVNRRMTIQEVATRLLDGENGCALVMHDKKCVGAITLDIIVAKTIATAQHPVATLSYEVMDENIIHVTPSTNLKEIWEKVQLFTPVAIVVLNEERTHVIGYVSPMDMVEAQQQGMI